MKNFITYGLVALGAYYIGFYECQRKALIIMQDILIKKLETE